MSVTSTALTKLTKGGERAFCQYCQFLTWGSARNSLAFSATLGRSSVVRGGVHERFCDALNELQAFSVARDDKTNDDRTRTPNGGLSLTPAPHTDKIDKRPRDSAEGWGAGDVVGENIHPKSRAGINFRLYRTGEITPENVFKWITCAVLHRRDVPFSNGRRYAPVVEVALTLPAVVGMMPKEDG